MARLALIPREVSDPRGGVTIPGGGVVLGVFFFFRKSVSPGEISDC